MYTLSQAYNPLLQKLIYLLTITISKIQQSHYLPKLNNPSDYSFRTSYIGEIIKQTLTNERERFIDQLLSKLPDKERKDWINDKRFKQKVLESNSEMVKYWLSGLKEIGNNDCIELEKENNKLNKQIDKLNNVIRDYVNNSNTQKKLRLETDNFKQSKFYKKQHNILLSQTLKKDIKYQIDELKLKLLNRNKNRMQQNKSNNIDKVSLLNLSSSSDNMWRQLLENNDCNLQSTSEQSHTKTDRFKKKRGNVGTPKRKMAMTQRSPVRDFVENQQKYQYYK